MSKALAVGFTLSILLPACFVAKPDLQKEEAAIRKLLAQERSAHFNRNAAQFVMDFSDSMISVNKGRVVKQSVEDYRKKFQSYFDNVEFHTWDDIEQPRISFSDEGSLAYAIVTKNVSVTHNEGSDTTEFAWVSIYRKLDGEWKLECNVSTNK